MTAITGQTIDFTAVSRDVSDADVYVITVKSTLTNYDFSPS